MSENVSTLYIYTHTYINTYAFLIVHTYTAMVPPQSPGLGHAFAPFDGARCGSSLIGPHDLVEVDLLGRVEEW